jgi:TrmH family RNA methyltransferase
VPAVEVDNVTALGWLRSNHIQVLASTPSARLSYTAADLRGPVAVAVGTEDEGLTDFWMSNADIQVLIPMMGLVNSLNVSIATALIVYEAVRQRG